MRATCLPPRSLRANAKFFDDAFGGGMPGIATVAVHPKAVSAWWLYTIRVLSGQRNRFFEFMKERQIVTSAVHQRNDTHSCVARFLTLLPRLNELADEIVCLPVGWWLTASDRERIVDAVRTFSATVAADRSIPRMLASDGASGRPRCMITGGCGFIGHHVVEHFARNTDYELVVLDKLSYASKGYDRLQNTGVFHQIHTFCVD